MAAVAATTRPQKAAYARMCPIRSMIPPQPNAPSVKPAKKLLSTRPAMVAPKSSIATRKEMKVPKKPLASWMKLVAMTSVPICARIDPLGPIALHRLAADKGTHLPGIDQPGGRER